MIYKILIKKTNKHKYFKYWLLILLNNHKSIDVYIKDYKLKYCHSKWY